MAVAIQRKGAGNLAKSAKPQPLAFLPPRLLKRLAESASLRPLHIVHILLTLLAVILAVCASLSPSPDRWVGVAAWFAVGIVIGAVITWVARTQDIRRTRHDLRLHLNPGRTNAYVAVFLMVLVAAVCAIAAITSK